MFNLGFAITSISKLFSGSTDSGVTFTFFIDKLSLFTFIFISFDSQTTFQSAFKTCAFIILPQSTKSVASISYIQSELLVVFNSFLLFTIIFTWWFFWVVHETFILFFQIINQFSGEDISISILSSIFDSLICISAIQNTVSSSKSYIFIFWVHGFLNLTAFSNLITHSSESLYV